MYTIDYYKWKNSHTWGSSNVCSNNGACQNCQWIIVSRPINQLYISALLQLDTFVLSTGCGGCKKTWCKTHNNSDHSSSLVGDLFKCINKHVFHYMHMIFILFYKHWSERAKNANMLKNMKLALCWITES